MRHQLVPPVGCKLYLSNADGTTPDIILSPALQAFTWPRLRAVTSPRSEPMMSVQSAPVALWSIGRGAMAANLDSLEASLSLLMRRDLPPAPDSPDGFVDKTFSNGSQETRPREWRLSGPLLYLAGMMRPPAFNCTRSPQGRHPIGTSQTALLPFSITVECGERSRTRWTQV
jgi:hypothetical protein